MKVCRGVTRTVLLTRRYAVKVPSLRRSDAGWTSHRYALRGRLWSFTAGIRANLSEAEWSPLLGDAVAPVLHSWLGGLVNVYPRAEPDGVAFALLAWFPDRYAVPALPDGLMTDAKPANLGVLDGRVVWVDYDQSQTDCHACRRWRHEHPRHLEAVR